MDRLYCVYIMANKRRTVLYVGVTNDLKRRAYEHRNHLVPGFTKRYNVDVLVYYEVCDDATSAIRREKQLKGGSRAAKIAAIESMNASWRDLFDEIWDRDDSVASSRLLRPSAEGLAMTEETAPARRRD